MVILTPYKSCWAFPALINIDVIRAHLHKGAYVSIKFCQFKTNFKVQVAWLHRIQVFHLLGI